jgi:vacuolar iron transporter family protein
VSDNRKLIAGLQAAWRDEITSARNYRGLAEREPITDRRAILLRLAETEDKHAATWEARLRELGAEAGPFTESLTERLRRWLLLRSGTEAAVAKLEAAENSADGMYGELMNVAPNEAMRAQLQEVQREEKAHSRVLNDMAVTGAAGVQSRLEKILGSERWHVHGGSWIGQAIYGINDGLGAAFGVVSGVAGATNVDSHFVLLGGIATAIASALSMGSGAYLATKSEREVYEAEIERERHEIEVSPEEEREEMGLFYQLKGFSPEEAKSLAARLAEKPDQLLKALAHEELGLSEKTFPDPWRSAVSAMLSTGAGAFIPIIPFFMMTGTQALIASFIISTAAHFAVGASKVIVTGRSWLKSGTEMTLVGLGEAVLTYMIGLWIAPMIH